MLAITDSFHIIDNMGGIAGLLLLLTVVETEHAVDMGVIPDEVSLGQPGVDTVSVVIL